MNTEMTAPRVIPSDKINLRLIMVTGKTHEFLFMSTDTAYDVARHVYSHWPVDWEKEKVDSPQVLRLIYQGRFLHGNVKLEALSLPHGRTTVMHLIAREKLPELSSNDSLKKQKNSGGSCCCTIV